MGDREVVDAAEEYAQHIPVRVIAKMLGFPEEDADRFRGFVNHVLEGVALPMEQRAEGMIALFEYLRAAGRGPHRQPARRPHLVPARAPRSTASSSSRTTSVGTMALLLLAGIDTTWSAIGASIWHLAVHAGRPGAAGRRARAAARPRWRSSSGPTRRSPWRGWCGRTWTSTAAR